MCCGACETPGLGQGCVPASLTICVHGCWHCVRPVARQPLEAALPDSACLLTGSLFFKNWTSCDMKDGFKVWDRLAPSQQWSSAGVGCQKALKVLADF